MAAFLVRRVLASALTLYLIVTISFFIMRLAPGGPFDRERPMSASERKALEKKYGLDKPLRTQYADYIVGLVTRGDLKWSMKNYDYTVNQLIADKIGNSFQLGGIAFAIAILGGVALGLVAAARKNRWPDMLAMSFSVFGVCVPAFLVGPLLILVFASALRWVAPTFPILRASPVDWILPAATLGLLPMAYVARLTRGGILDVLGKDYIRTARAKGLRERRVLLVHALKNGITPVISYSGPMAAQILTGSLVVERVFNFPGLGQYFVNAALNRDYTMMLGVLVVYSTLLIALNLVVDLSYGLLDPRVRVS